MMNMEKQNMMIKNERVAVVSDLHIGKHQNSPRWHNIALDFAKWFKENLIRENISDIIICGDVNDDRNEISVQTLHTLNDMFTIWKDFNIIILVGNHDSYYKNRTDVNSLSLFSGWDNITIIDQVTPYRVFGKDIIFCPWNGNLSGINKCDYLFGHLEINGFSMSKMKVCTGGIDSPNILKLADMTISGHFHAREDRKYKNGRILYLGSPYEMDWGDCGTTTRGFYYLDIPTGKYDFVENTLSPKHKKIRMSEITAAGKLTDDIRKEFKGNFINFIVDQEIKNFDKLGNFIATLGALGAVSIKTEYLLENRVSVEDSEYEFNSVDIPASIEEFIKMTDYEDKDIILDEITSLYETCKQGDD